MAFLYFKAVHVVFVVSWFAGLFYIVRLFIYHVEAQDRPETERNILQTQYIIMQRRLWRIITMPAMVLTVLSGVGMIYLAPFLLDQPWMHVKLSFVLLLLVYHFACYRMMIKLRKNEMPASSVRLRMWNEVATVLLVAIVFTVILKSTSQWVWGVGGLISLGVLLMAIVKLVNNDK